MLRGHQGWFHDYNRVDPIGPNHTFDISMKRQAARVLVFNPDQQLLLINGVDPVQRSAPPWWEIPGGGIDPGEASIDAVRRELWEEAGIADATIGPCLWTQEVNYTFAGIKFHQQEFIHIAHFDGDQGAPGGLEALEQLAFGEQRWWNLDELRASPQRTIPYRLIEYLATAQEWLNATPPTPSSPFDMTPTADHIAAWNAMSSP